MHPVRLTFLALVLALPALCRAETLEEIADRAKPATLGVAVCDPRTGEITGVNIDRPFPLQSVFKAFLAAAILSRVDSGQLSLDKTVTIAPADLADGVGPVDNSHGGNFTVLQLLRAAVINSDNTAADTLLPLAGGPPGLTCWLMCKQIDGIRIDRDERAIARDLNGIPATLSPGKNASALRSQVSDADHRTAFEAGYTDPRDTATPKAAVQFLVALDKGKLLSPASTKLLLGLMRETSTGPARLKAGLPPNAVLAHKTGTSGTFDGVTLATNDIGLVTLPDGRGFAIAAFLMASPAANKDREAFLAASAQAAVQAVEAPAHVSN